MLMTGSRTPGLPSDGYALLVDGLVKTEFETRQGADDGARDLKRRFPALQVKVYDAQAKADHEVRI
jgi:hypothetical protein